jgi:thioredoxin 1
MFLFFFWLASAFVTSLAEGSRSIPVEGMVTLVDLGAKSCIPCKMMAPILKKLKKAYKDKAAIIFIDVSKDRKMSKRFRIRAIPTQIFFDEKGKEVYRHQGFMSQKAIEKQLKKMGVN